MTVWRGIAIGAAAATAIGVASAVMAYRIIDRSLEGAWR